MMNASSSEQEEKEIFRTTAMGMVVSVSGLGVLVPMRVGPIDC
jgi:hypothetical protein